MLPEKIALSPFELFVSFIVAPQNHIMHNTLVKKYHLGGCINIVICAIVLLCMTLITGCTTTSIASHRVDQSNTQYLNFVVVALDNNIQIRKITEDKTTDALKGAGLHAIQGYKIHFPDINESKEQFIDSIVKSGADAVLTIGQTNASNNFYTIQGTQAATALDNRGNTYIYQQPSSESYKSTSRKFRATIIDIKTNKVVWLADSESKTLSPAEIGMFTDFFETSLNSYIQKLIEEMKAGDLIPEK